MFGARPLRCNVVVPEDIERVTAVGRQFAGSATDVSRR
jgi:hypothetical protein